MQVERRAELVRAIPKRSRYSPCVIEQSEKRVIVQSRQRCFASQTRRKSADKREQCQACFQFVEREQTRGEVRVKPCRELKILCPDNVKTSPQNYEKALSSASKNRTIFLQFSILNIQCFQRKAIAVGTTGSYTPSVKLLR